MPLKKATSESEAVVLEGITDIQQYFIQALLSGKNFTEAAISSGVSRRTATY